MFTREPLRGIATRRPCHPAARIRASVPTSTDLPPPPARPEDREGSEILRMAALCKQVGGVDLAAGIPSTPADEGAAEAAVRAIRGGENTYSDPRGIAELRAAIADKLRRENGLDHDPEREVLVTTGITGGFAAAVMALFQAGDEVLVPEPFFELHVDLLRLAGLTPRFVRSASPTSAPTREELLAAVGPRTRGIVLCTPSNPGGAVYSARELEGIAEVAAERDLLVVTDEQYEHFCFDGARHVSPAAIGGLRGRTVTLMGFSKSLAVTGWRVGYAAGPRHLIERVQRMHTLLYLCAATPLQRGVLGALTGPRGSRGETRAELQRKRDTLCRTLEEVGFRVHRPAGGFFVLAQGGPLSGIPARAAARALLEHVGVAAVPGGSFFSGDGGEGFLRFCFAKSDAEIDEACRLLRSLERPAVLMNLRLALRGHRAA